MRTADEIDLQLQELEVFCDWLETNKKSTMDDIFIAMTKSRIEMLQWVMGYITKQSWKDKP